MITIIYGETGAGKTGLLTHIGNMAAFNRSRNGAMIAEIEQRIKDGFKLTIPKHCVASNVDMTFSAPFCYPRKPRLIDPDKLGLQYEAPEGVRCHYTLPYETILIDEGQKYFYSKGAALPKYKTDFFDKNRHNDLDIYIATPSAILISKDIRRLARLWYILKRELIYQKGKLQTRWIIAECARCYDEAYDEFMEDYKAWSKENQGKIVKDTKGYCFEIREIIANYNIFTLYNHQSHRGDFISGHVGEDFDLDYGTGLEPRTFEEFRRLEEKRKNG